MSCVQQSVPSHAPRGTSDFPCEEHAYSERGRLLVADVSASMIPSQLWIACDFSLITHDNVGSQSLWKGLASWRRPYAPGTCGGSCYAVQRFKWCSYTVLSCWQLKISSSNPDSKFSINSGRFAWHWKAFLWIPKWFVSVSTCLLSCLFDFGHKRKKTTTSK